MNNYSRYVLNPKIFVARWVVIVDVSLAICSIFLRFKYGFSLRQLWV